MALIERVIRPVIETTMGVAVVALFVGTLIFPLLPWIVIGCLVWLATGEFPS